MSIYLDMINETSDRMKIDYNISKKTRTIYSVLEYTLIARHIYPKIRIVW